MLVLINTMFRSSKTWHLTLWLSESIVQTLHRDSGCTVAIWQMGKGHCIKRSIGAGGTGTWPSVLHTIPRHMHWHNSCPILFLKRTDVTCTYIHVIFFCLLSLFPTRVWVPRGRNEVHFFFFSLINSWCLAYSGTPKISIEWMNQCDQVYLDQVQRDSWRRNVSTERRTGIVYPQVAQSISSPCGLGVSWVRCVYVGRDAV